MGRSIYGSVLAAALAAGALGLAGGCGTLAGSPGGGGKKGGGTPAPQPVAPPAAIAPVTVAPIAIAMTDAAIDDAQSVFVTIDEVDVSTDGKAWTKIPLATETEIDLLQYQDGNSLDLAGFTQLGAGTYTQTRLILDPAHPPRLVETDGTEDPLTIPSATASGIKIATPFTLVAGTTLNLTIDFDLRKSVKANNGKNGPKYTFDPTLRLVDDAGAGAVIGQSAGGKTICLYAKGTTEDSDDGGDNAVTCGIVKDGTAHIAFVPAGTYGVRIFPASGKPVDAPSVTVTAGQTSDLGTLPL